MKETMRCPIMRCPIIGCKTDGYDTLLNITKTGSYKCPKCDSEWNLVLYSPMYVCWREVKKPKEGKQNENN